MTLCNYIKKKSIFYVIYRLVLLFAAFFGDMATLNATDGKSNKFKSNPLKKSRIKRTSKKTCDLSVIVPVYNVENYLQEAILSIVNQKTSWSYELILVNDCSSDSSGEIINYFGGLNNVKVITHDNNRGQSASRNSALEIAQGEYVTFVDSDDLFHGHAINLLMTIAKKYDCDVVEGAVEKFTRKLNIPETPMNMGQETVLHNYADIAMAATGFNCGKLFRKQLFKDINFPEGLIFEDAIIRKIVLRKAATYVKTSETLYYYRRNNECATTKNIEKKNKGCDQFYIIDHCVEEFLRLGFKPDVIFYKQILREAGPKLKNRTYYMDQCDIRYMLRKISKTLSYIESQLHTDLKLSIREKILRWAILNGQFRVWRASA